MAEIHLLYYTLDAQYKFLLGAFQDEMFAQAYIKEIEDLIREYDRIENEFSQAAYIDGEDGWTEIPNADELWNKEYQPQLDEIQAKLRKLILNRASKNTKENLEKITDDPYNLFTNYSPRSFSIDSIELSIPLAEVKKHFGKFIK